MIEVNHLTKRYGKHLAVSDLSFTIEKGKIYGFLGPNGAGKSTTMNIITGCLAATAGQVLVDGHDIYSDANAAKRCIGYLPEQPPLYPDMTPNEYLCFVGQAKGLRRAALSEQVRLAMERTQITEMRDRLIRNLSKGYRQRVGIAQALLGDPDVIILDEPTVGLDPKQIIEIRDLIRDLGRDHTVILSSHILPEVQAVCDVVLILAHGKLVASDTPENLTRNLTGESTLRMLVKAPGEELSVLLQAVPGARAVTVCPSPEEGVCSVELKSTEDLRESVFFALCDRRFPILSMSQVTVTLEDVFLELTADQPPAPDAAAAEAAPAIPETASEQAEEKEDEDNASDLQA